MKFLRLLAASVVFVVVTGTTWPCCAENSAATTVRSRSQQAADTIVTIGPLDSWQPGDELLLQGMGAVWQATASPSYYEFIKQSVDRVLSGGATLIDPSMGEPLLLLYGATGVAKYYKAATALWQRDISETYTGISFYAEYAKTFQQPERFTIIAQQISGRSRRPQDAGGQAMELVDTLSYFPSDNPQRDRLAATFKQLAATIKQQQDPTSGLWRARREAKGGNPGELDLLTSCLFVYALEKGVRLAYLPMSYQQVGRRGYAGILRRFARTAADGSTVVSAAGGDGETSDHAPMGAYLLASTEDEMADTALLGHGKTVLLDAWFNSQKKQNAAGQTVYFHYKWEDLADSGFSFFGNAFLSYGVKTDTLYTAPAMASLSKAQIYVIASPDIPIKNPHPNYMSAQDADEIARWVGRGGVLVMMENDGKNAEFEHFNQLSERFGIHFNPVVNNKVPGQDFEPGRLLVPADAAMFLHAHKIFMKEICSITASAPARSTLTWESNTVMAVANYGKGTVLAVVDPWLYNEYTDGRKLPASFDNLAAGKEVIRWLIQQVPAR